VQSPVIEIFKQILCPIRATVLGIGWSGDRQERSVAREVKQSAA
jgi:hypothetical protein